MIFNREFYKNNLLRANKFSNKGYFLIEESSNYIRSRVETFEKSFQNGLVYGKFDGEVPSEKFTSHNLIGENSFDEEVGYNTEIRDLIISNLSLSFVNDIPKAIANYKKILNGLFVFTVFGQDTLKELKQAFFETDIEEFNAGIPHIIPTIAVKDAAHLLSGFEMPISDSYKFKVKYGKLNDLFNDIKGLGFSACFNNNTKPFLSRKYFEKIENKLYGDLTFTIEIVTATGFYYQ